MKIFNPTCVIDHEGDRWHRYGEHWDIDEMLVDVDGCGPHDSLDDLNRHHGPVVVADVDDPERLARGAMGVIHRCLRWIDIHDNTPYSSGEYAMAAAAILGDLCGLDITANREMCGPACAVHHQFTKTCKLREQVEP